MPPALPTKIWSIQVPVNGRCATLSDLWIDRPSRGNCPVCERALDAKTPAQIEVEWDIGCDRVCDFVFTIGPIVLRAEIADELLKRFTGFTKGEVRMHDHPALYRPKRITKRTPKRVWLPYEGPELCYMRISNEVELHPSSTVEIESSCDECGTVIYEEFEGIEEKNSAYHKARQPGMGFFFEKSALRGVDFFRPKHTGFTFCTDRAKNFMEKREYQNVEFMEVGDLISGKLRR
jgi:hypothetical protein